MESPFPPRDLTGSSHADVQRILSATESLDSRLSELFAPVYFPSLNRTQVCLRQLFTSLSHGRGIRLLVDSTEYQPAFALMRPCIETFLRGVWVCDSASEAWMDSLIREPDEGEGFRSEHVSWPSLSSIPHDLRTAGRRVEADQVEDFLGRLGDGAHADVHGGYRSLVRAFDRTPWLQLVKLLYYRNAVVSNAYAYLAVIADRRDLARALNDIVSNNSKCFWTPPGLVGLTRGG